MSTRRSVATGCWRAISWKRAVLESSPQRVDLGSSEMTARRREVGVEQRAGGALHGDADQLDHRRRASRRSRRARRGRCRACCRTSPCVRRPHAELSRRDSCDPARTVNRPVVGERALRRAGPIAWRAGAASGERTIGAWRLPVPWWLIVALARGRRRSGSLVVACRAVARAGRPRPAPPAPTPRRRATQSPAGAGGRGARPRASSSSTATSSRAGQPGRPAMGVLDADRLAVRRAAASSPGARSTTGERRSRARSTCRGRLGREPIALSVAGGAAAGRGRPAAGRGGGAAAVDDVTEQRRLEAVRRDFVANVSHELKTPVGALTLLAEAVQDAADDPEAVAPVRRPDAARGRPARPAGRAS